MMDTKKAPYIQRWIRGIGDRCAGDMEDIINPRIDIDQVNWQQSSEHCFIQAVIGDIADLPRAFLYEHHYDAERRGDDTKLWLIARFANDVFLLNLFLSHAEEKNIILIAAMRMLALLERSRLFPGGSFIVSLYLGLQKLDDRRRDMFFRFLCPNGACARAMRGALHSFTEFEQVVLSSIEQ